MIIVEKAKLKSDSPAQIVLAELSRQEYLKRTIRNHEAFKDPFKPTSESIGNMEMKDFCCDNWQMTIGRMLII
ncbi:FLYWCH-type domain-containing protein [Aphis craccivora]|uniref:FLYWCH-type domain-containing protein n=1 Tax=Aphis craccivora TaxID=307492 RepID=A0A6G0Z049_APHCR|nr:FLYWCH-type domain-containing protein [Aphis craccivora]